MPLVSVPAIFDGQEIHLLEAPPVNTRYRVLVTFVEAEQADAADKDRQARRFSDLEGIWKDYDISLDDIKASEYRMPDDL